MKLETKFHKAIFFPFFLGVAFSIVSVSVLLFLMSYQNINTQTQENLLQTEEELTSLYIYSVNTILAKMITTSQKILEQNLNQFFFLSENLPDQQIKETIINAYDDKSLENSDKKGMWFVSKEINQNFIDDPTNNPLEEPIQKRINVFSQMIHAIYTSNNLHSKSILSTYMFFLDSELILYYPVSRATSRGDKGLIGKMKSYKNPNWCVNKDKDYFDLKCREWMNSLMENFVQDPTREVFIIPPYKSLESEEIEFSICLKFTDPFTQEEGIICNDNDPTSTFDTIDQINSSLRGHFVISSINNVKPFYYPNIENSNLNNPLSSYEFDKDDYYYLEELTFFNENVSIILTNGAFNMEEPDNNAEKEEKAQKDLLESNDPLILFKQNYKGSFTKNNVIYNFTIFPFITERNQKLSKCLNIVYIYQESFLYDHLFSYQTGFKTKLYLEVILFVLFGVMMLIIIWISMISLAKYIVIPIKNVQYMLKGINIGGENRLDFLNALQNKEKEESIQEKELKELKDDNGIVNNININITTTSNENENLISVSQVLSKEKEDNIENELHFYDYDEELLQYRPKEINTLVTVLLDLKSVLILTSSPSTPITSLDKIINYSESRLIFENVKNKEGSFICQSNVGNICSVCLFYDKSIYHLNMSLQIPKLKKFLSRTISDELDTSNRLLHLIESQYNKNNNEEIINILVKKQQTSSSQSHSQKQIGNLINNRYNKLVKIYFDFFSLLKKSKRKYEDLSGLFLHTSFHTINHYNKILIQYVYLCYVSNDLIKIGESILDYIEFLLKFKLQTSNTSYLNKNIPAYAKIQENKKKIFDKVVLWFQLFDHYTNHVNENTTLGNDKIIIDAYLNNANGESQFNQSAFQYKINIQRSNFLKGKFALICKDYTDALSYFSSAGKNNKNLVYDVLIKKKALKKVSKIIQKLSKKISNIKRNDPQLMKMANSLAIIKSDINSELSFLKTLKLKDILVIIDTNNLDNSDYETYIDEMKNILKIINDNERFAFFIFDIMYRLICPLNYKRCISLPQIQNYLKSFSMDEFKFFDAQTNKTKFFLNFNYCINYLLIKQNELNEKFIIIFTNYFDCEAGSRKDFFDSVKKEKGVNLVIVGKFGEEPMDKEYLLGYGNKSDFIGYNEMKKIKTVLAGEVGVEEKVIFPNEIYESNEAK